MFNQSCSVSPLNSDESAPLSAQHCLNPVQGGYMQSKYVPRYSRGDVAFDIHVHARHYVHSHENAATGSSLSESCALLALLVQLYCLVPRYLHPHALFSRTTSHDHQARNNRWPHFNRRSEFH
jgi:hypothetical protein